MNNLIVFNNSEFGEVRVVEINNEPWLVGKDIADCLGYNEPHKAIARHIDEEDRTKHPIHTNGGLQNGRLPFGQAVKFTRWSYWISKDKFFKYLEVN